MKALELFNKGELDAAVAAATDHVRSSPADAVGRVLLSELLCFLGDFERADRQLEVASDTDPTFAVAVAQFRQVVRAEVARHDFHDGRQVPGLLSDPTPQVRARLNAAVQARAQGPKPNGNGSEVPTAGSQNRSGGQAAGGTSAAVAGGQGAIPAGGAGAAAEHVSLSSSIEEAMRQHVPASGTCDGQRFDDFLDADDLLGPILEVLGADGRYLWVPVETIQSLKFEPPRRPRDVLFRQARLAVRDGPEGEVFVPALYAHTWRSPRVDLRLGRATDWVNDPSGLVRGVGQRTFLVGDEGRAILDLREIRFDK